MTLSRHDGKHGSRFVKSLNRYIDSRITIHDHRPAATLTLETQPLRSLLAAAG